MDNGDYVYYFRRLTIMAAVNKTKFCFAEKCVLYVYDLRKNCLNTKENIVDVSACQSFDELYDRILKVSNH